MPRAKKPKVEETAAGGARGEDAGDPVRPARAWTATVNPVSAVTEPDPVPTLRSQRAGIRSRPGLPLLGRPRLRARRARLDRATARRRRPWRPPGRRNGPRSETADRLRLRPQTRLVRRAGRRVAAEPVEATANGTGVVPTRTPTRMVEFATRQEPGAGVDARGLPPPVTHRDLRRLPAGPRLRARWHPGTTGLDPGGGRVAGAAVSAAARRSVAT
jgi:hypothetical protein